MHPVLLHLIKTTPATNALPCRAALAMALALTTIPHHVQASEPWTLGLVLDASVASRELALGARQKGLQLGHSDLTATGGLGRHLHAQITAVAATHDGRLERDIEEAWIETRTLPWGLNLRAGRFASQIGAINAQHPHADDFADRPLLYRGFLGQHWTDDGVRLNVTLPAPVYWMVGLEAFKGQRLVPEAEAHPRGLAAYTLNTRLGGDLDRANSWQVGLSTLSNRRTLAAEEEHGHGGDAAHEHESHGARFAGRRTTWVDATWKWAPQGNNRKQQVRITVEVAQISDIHPDAPGHLNHRGQALGAVWRFQPNWEVGARFDRLRAQAQHEGDWEPRRLNEQSVMLAWKPSHLQTLRLQWSRQHGVVGFEGAPASKVLLQYILSFGQHGAHSF